jgi:hypothetical protein
MNATELTNALGAALGLPKGTTKAVLTLEVGKLPTLEITMFALDYSLTPQRLFGSKAAEEIPKIHFMLRLEPFPEDLK